MADAPAPKSSSWGAFEVILGLLLAIGLLSSLQGKPIASVTNDTPPKDNNTPIDNSAAWCGLSITSPLALQNVSGSIALSGSVNGCAWNPDGNKALFAQVVNSSGVPISDFVTVEGDGSNFLTVAFNAIININGNPTGTGYLILIPAVTQSDKTVSVRIPLHFVRR